MKTPNYQLHQRVKIKGTNFKGTIMKKRSLIESLFGVIPKYQLILDIENTYVNNTRKPSTLGDYRDGDLEILTDEEDIEGLM